jgi:hypothetical protein
MARGWESKSIESQIESASESSPDSAGHKQLSDDERKRNREREQLLLSRTYVQRQLEAAGNERYRELLGKELAEIERKLGEFGSRK